MPEPKDYSHYVGQKINGLLVLQILPRNAHGTRKFWLRCPCTREFSASVSNVLGGAAQRSCGWLNGRKKPLYAENGQTAAEVIASELTIGASQ
jgi:hypothetical protein